MTADARQCPECGGQIHAIAGRCKHCKATLSPLDDNARAEPRTAGAQQPGADMRARAPRWPLIVAAIALLAIGVSIGMMLERWMQSNRDSAIEHRRPGNRPREVPDRMPRANPRPDSTHPR